MFRKADHTESFKNFNWGANALPSQCRDILSIRVRDKNLRQKPDPGRTPRAKVPLEETYSQGVGAEARPRGGGAVAPGCKPKSPDSSGW